MTAKGKFETRPPDPGDPKKRKPASVVGTESGPDRKTSRDSAEQPEKYHSADSLPSLTVTSGRETIGYIAERGRKFVALDVDGRELGSFRSLKEASRAIPCEVAS